MTAFDPSRPDPGTPSPDTPRSSRRRERVEEDVMANGLVAAGAGALALSAILGAAAQIERVERPKSERAPFDAAVNALGMERGIRRDQRSINTVYFVGHGTMSTAAAGDPLADREITRAHVSVSYHLPAIRSDVTWRDGAGQEVRQIRVANGRHAWDETEPGVGASATRDSAAERLLQVWLTPHGVLRAMVEARAKDPGAVTVARHDQATVLSMVLEGGPLEVELDGEQRPRRLRWKLAGRAIEVEYSDYKDWELLDVFFPQRIVQRVDGRVVLALDVTDFRSNPYVVFPVPAVARPGG
jgi:hypothetical protein